MYVKASLASIPFSLSSFTASTDISFSHQVVSLYIEYLCASNPSDANASFNSCAITPTWIRASSPFSATLSLYLNFLIRPLHLVATFFSVSVRSSISCFSFLSEEVNEPVKYA